VDAQSERKKEKKKGGGKKKEKKREGGVRKLMLRQKKKKKNKRGRKGENNTPKKEERRITRNKNCFLHLKNYGGEGKKGGGGKKLVGEGHSIVGGGEKKEFGTQKKRGKGKPFFWRLVLRKGKDRQKDGGKKRGGGKTGPSPWQVGKEGVGKGGGDWWIAGNHKEKKSSELKLRGGKTPATQFPLSSPKKKNLVIEGRKKKVFFNKEEEEGGKVSKIHICLNLLFPRKGGEGKEGLDKEGGKNRVFLHPMLILSHPTMGGGEGERMAEKYWEKGKRKGEAIS